MSKPSTKMYRWKFLDRLLSQGRPVSQTEIMEAYQSDSVLRLIPARDYERKNEEERKEHLALHYLKSLRKDLSLFRKALSQNNLEDMLVVGRGAEDKLYGDGKDRRTKTFNYRDSGFSIIPFLTGEMTDGEFRKLSKAIRKLKGVLNDTTFDEVCFTVFSRVAADYGKGLQCVEYEDNRRLKGRQYRPLIYNAIVEKLSLKIRYRDFEGVEYEYEFHPYLLKQYNERWFAFGLSPDFDNNPYVNVPLDRLLAPPEPIGHYEESVPEDYLDYFSSIVGVTRYTDRPVEHIVIRIYDPESWGRAVTKPLTTQKVVEEYDSASRVGTLSLDVVPNEELFSKILSWGRNVEIVSPSRIRKRMRKIVEALAERYADETTDKLTKK